MLTRIQRIMVLALLEQALMHDIDASEMSRILRIRADFYHNTFYSKTCAA